MKNLILLHLLILSMCGNQAKQQENNLIAILEVHSGAFERLNTPVSIDLDAITPLPIDELALFEKTTKGLTEVPTQLFQSGQRQMYWHLSGETTSGTIRTFELVRTEKKDIKTNKSIIRSGGNLVLTSNDKPVLQYNAATSYPPEGVDTIFKRSAFIHPLYSPAGAILTNIQPQDHYHHYGIWNPWTKTNLRDEEIDFWNLGKGQGTVRHGGLVSASEGTVFSGIGALHQHIAWPETTREVVAMNETMDIKVFEAANGIFLIDIAILLNPNEPIDLEEYRYGGFCLRGTASWTNQTSDFVTSEGLDRDQADGERARWCVVAGDTPEGRAGVLFLGNPANFNHPEPLRVWPSDANGGRGDVFINFSPTRNTTWSLEANQTYLLRYRMLVFDGAMDANTAEIYWNDYAHPPNIHIKGL